MAQLADEGFALPDDYENTISGLELETQEPGAPWYVRLFAGLSAWIAALFLIAFLFTANILQEDESAIFAGLLFCAIAVGLKRPGSRNDFLEQLGLALSLAGQVLFVVGLGSLWEEVVPVALALIVLEILLLWAYPDILHRFISTIIIVGALLAIILNQDMLEATHILIFALSVIAFILYWQENRLLLTGLRELTRPVSYGIAVSLLGLLILPLIEDADVRWWQLTAALLLGVLLFLVWQIAADLGLASRSEVMIWLAAGCVALFIPAIRMPGILGALIILLLGFWRNNRLLIGLASVFLVFYLGAIYYVLEWTLLEKSFALLVTGLVLFLLRYVLLRFTEGDAI
ncbi:MAG TPA: DUF4401 domain-containing protein [Chloroflexi bacterium]|nr:DUF4401 domain-containing protein [Chloroflexota bacterium]